MIKKENIKKISGLFFHQLLFLPFSQSCSFCGGIEGQVCMPQCSMEAREQLQVSVFCSTLFKARSLGLSLYGHAPGQLAQEPSQLLLSPPPISLQEEHQICRCVLRHTALTWIWRLVLESLSFCCENFTHGAISGQRCVPNSNN